MSTQQNDSDAMDERMVIRLEHPETGDLLFFTVEDMMVVVRQEFSDETMGSREDGFIQLTEVDAREKAQAWAQERVEEGWVIV